MLPTTVHQSLALSTDATYGCSSVIKQKFQHVDLIFSTKRNQSSHKLGSGKVQDKTQYFCVSELKNML